MLMRSIHARTDPCMRVCDPAGPSSAVQGTSKSPPSSQPAAIVTEEMKAYWDYIAGNAIVDVSERKQAKMEEEEAKEVEKELEAKVQEKAEAEQVRVRVM
jgi:hypothetical protein